MTCSRVRLFWRRELSSDMLFLTLVKIVYGELSSDMLFLTLVKIVYVMALPPIHVLSVALYACYNYISYSLTVCRPNSFKAE